LNVLAERRVRLKKLGNLLGLHRTMTLDRRLLY
jgi:hypothetical protein